MEKNTPGLETGRGFSFGRLRVADKVGRFEPNAVVEFVAGLELYVFVAFCLERCNKPAGLQCRLRILL